MFTFSQRCSQYLSFECYEGHFPNTASTLKQISTFFSQACCFLRNCCKLVYTYTRSLRFYRHPFILRHELSQNQGTPISEGSLRAESMFCCNPIRGATPGFIYEMTCITCLIINDENILSKEVQMY